MKGLYSFALFLALGHAGFAAPASVVMRSISFEPKILSLRVGESVVWENRSLTPHSATGDAFDSGMIKPGENSTAITFSKAGSYTYHCKIHGRTMSGRIDVR